MNMGYVQSFDERSLTEFLVEEAGLHHADIKNVVVEEQRSHFVVDQKYQQLIFLNLKGMKLYCRNLKLTLDERIANGIFICNRTTECYKKECRQYQDQILVLTAFQL